MTRRFMVLGLLAAACFSMPFSATAAPDTTAPTAQTWSASGTLLESCTCAVPCTCNFGEGPSPHSYCHAVFAYRLEKATWNGTDLSGLIIGGADGPKGIIGFFDESATPEQRPFLEKIARAILAQGGPAGGPRRFVAAHITHSVQGNNLKLEIPGHGGFSATVITGRDGKSPIIVENNTVWPIPRAIKAKSKPLAYSDAVAGVFRGDGTNANYGKFSLSGPIVKAAMAKPAKPSQVAVAKKGIRVAACCEIKGKK